MTFIFSSVVLVCGSKQIDKYLAQQESLQEIIC